MVETGAKSGLSFEAPGLERLVTMGTCGGPYGVRGWVRIGSHTVPKPAIFDIQPWWVEVRGERRVLKVEHWRENGRHLVAKLEGFEDPDAIGAIKGAGIKVERGKLPTPEADEYYWCDLLGLEVRTVNDELLGAVEELFETGSNDVKVVGRERHLVPFLVGQVVKEVDLRAGVVRVDWDVELLS